MVKAKITAKSNGTNGKSPVRVRKTITKRTEQRVPNMSRTDVNGPSKLFPVVSPQAYSGNFMTGRANVGNLGNGAVRVRHREFLSDVFGVLAGNFVTYQYAVNPGLANTFPWLSSLAQRFEKYRFNMLKFDYLPSCAVTVPGTVMAAFDLDASDPAPVSKVQLMAYQNANRAPPWGGWCVHLPGGTDFRDRYVRRFGAPTGTDVKMYDVANLWLGTSGTSATTQLGELYVEYDVILEVPQIQDINGSGTVESTLGLGATLADPWRAIGTTFLGAIPVVVPNVVGNAGRLYISGVFPGQSFLITTDFKGTGIASLTFAPEATAGQAFNLLGPVSASVTTVSATAVLAFSVVSVISGQVGANAVLNGLFAITATATGATLLPGGATFTISPWQSNLAFP